MNQTFRHFSKIALLLTTLLATACDEGDIYPGEPTGTQTGGVARICGTFSGIETWRNADYHVAIAAFATNGTYAEVSHNIQADSENGNADIILTGIADNVETVRICAIDNLRKQIVEFASYPIAGYNLRDTIRIEVGTVDVSTTAAVQQKVFNTTCIGCHGKNTSPAAGLNLTDGKSLASLCGVNSTVMPDSVRLVAGQPDRSLIYHALSSNMSSVWKYDHSREVVDQPTLNLIKNWIESIEN